LGQDSYSSHLHSHPEARLPKQFSIAEARDRLPRLVHDAERGEHIELTRRGRPVAVLLSISEVQRLSEARVGLAEALTAFRSSVDWSQAGLDDESLAGLRDRTPGRPLPA
jgi:prevent-host-death family protein